MNHDDEIKDGKIPEGMIVPKLETTKATIRKTIVGEDGLTREVEEEIDVPVFPNNDTKNEVDELPTEIQELIKNSSLPYELLESYETFKTKHGDVLEKYGFVRNYMSQDYRDKDTDELVLSFAGFPNDESENKLVEIAVSDDGNWNVFGIKIGDKFENLEELDRKLSEHNYSKDELDGDYQYKNGKVTIGFEVDTESGKIVIKRISVKISSDYLGNKIY